MQFDVEVVLDWINRLRTAPRRAKRYERALSILSMLQRLGPPSPGDTRRKPLSQAQRHRLLQQVNGAMSKYRYHYWVMDGPGVAGQNEWAVYMEMTDQSGSDGGLAAALMDLGAHLVSRISFCNCGKAFYRRFEHQQYCSETCRLSFYTSSDKWKKYRRDKAREYYWLHKRGIVKTHSKTRSSR